MKEILLSTHDGSKNKLVEESPNYYRLVPEYDYVRFGFDNDNNILFVDPSGGPFMEVGKFFKRLGTLEKIESTSQGTFLTFKP